MNTPSRRFALIAAMILAFSPIMSAQNNKQPKDGKAQFYKGKVIFLSDLPEESRLSP